MNEYDKKVFANNLNYFLNKNNKKQADLCKLLNVSKSTVSSWCNAQKIPRMDKIETIAIYFNVKKSDLIEDKSTELENHHEASNITPLSQQLYNTPVFENVSAGFGTAAINSVIDYIPLPFCSKAEADETICIKVKGDSMSPKIEDGDIIQVHKQSSVDSGDVAVVLIDGEEGLVKKIEYNSNYIKLISFNPYYPPIEFNGADVIRISVVGKVKRILRDL